MTIDSPGSSAQIAGMIKRLRLVNNMSQQRLATRAGVALRSIQNLESGSDVQLSTFLRVADALGRAQSVRSALNTPSVMPMDLLLLGGERKRPRPAAFAPRRGLDSDRPHVGDDARRAQPAPSTDPNTGPTF